MEVRVESADGFGVPPGCYVGVRVGDVLKQGKYEPKRCHRFPSIDRRRNMRIDIYRHVGSCVIAVDPGTKSTHEAQVSSSDPTVPQMKFNVNVQSGGEERRPRTTERREGRSTDVKNQAKDYLSKYNIEDKLSDAVKALLKERPEDPTAFLCKHLLGAASLPASHAGKPSGPAVAKPFNGYYKANFLPSSSQSCMNDIYSKFPAAAQGLQPERIQSLRNQARDVLLKGSANGVLAEALRVQLERIHALRNQARDVLLKGNENGALAEALRASVAGQPPFSEYYKANCLPSASQLCMNDIYSKFPAAAQGRIHVLRNQARDILVKGSEDGVLVEALRASKAA